MKHIYLLFILLLFPAISTRAATQFFDGDIRYEICSDTSKTARVMANDYSGNIIIPDSVNYHGITYMVTDIGEAAFKDCTNLNSITLPKNLEIIGDSAFYYCTDLNIINIPNKVTTIGNFAFMFCKNITELYIPASVINIGIGVTSGCLELTKFIVNDDNEDYTTSDGVLLNSLMNEIIAYPNMYNSSYTIPSTIKSINDYAFAFCTNLKDINIPDNVTYLGVNAFNGCSSLTNIDIPSSIQDISDSAFENCSSLTSITLQEPLFSIGNNSFSVCRALKTIINYNDTPPKCEENSFKDVDQFICDLYIPDNNTDLYKRASIWKNFIVEPRITSGVYNMDLEEEPITVTGHDYTIYVQNAPDGANITIYNILGEVVYSGPQTSIMLSSKGTYLINVEGKVYKIML